MPRLSVLMIRAALLYLGVGFLFGGLMLFNKGIPFEPLVWRLLPIHVEFLLFGWIMQLAMGVAFWIAPRFSTPPRHGRVWLAVFACILLNLGIWMMAAGHWGSSPAFQLGGRIGIFISGIAFIAHIAPRIKPLAMIEVH